LSFESLEEITYKASHEYLEEGTSLFKVGDHVEKIYILADGAIECFVSLADEDLMLDEL
jgi:hypothetical protein